MEYVEDRKEALLNSQLLHLMSVEEKDIFGSVEKQVALTNGIYERALEMNPMRWVGYVGF
jgi:hypothetical protein